MPATLADRALAFAIDMALVTTAALVAWGAGGSHSPYAFIALGAAVSCVYSTWLHGARGQTFGKQVLGLRVAQTDGIPLGYWRSFFRYLSMVATLSPLTFWIARFDEKKRMLHDRLSGSVVVRVTYFSAAPKSDPVEFAGFWIRLSAFFVDLLVVLTLECPWFLLMIWLGKKGLSRKQSLLLATIDDLSLGGIAVLYSWILVALYGATIGKMAFEIAVVRRDGVPVSWRLALARAITFWSLPLAGYLFSRWTIPFDDGALQFAAGCVTVLLSVFLCAAPFLGSVVAAFDRQKRALHDRICRTLVVYLR
jgi:uncharacterized RDD family membrane protein YckC